MRLLVTFAALLALVGAQAQARSAPKPNLRVAALSFSTQSVAPGGDVSISETTSNAGSGRAGKSVTAYFLSADARKDANDRRIGSRSVSALKARKRSTKKLSLAIPAAQAAGTFRLIACADDKRKLKEKSERDNCRTAVGSLVVSTPAAPGPQPGSDTPPADGSSTPGPGPTEPGPGPDTPTPPNTSEQIAAVRAAPDGVANIPVEGAVVTYLKPALGNDPAGFFVQAANGGPALFVGVNPVGLIPSPAVGDRVRFTVTAMDTIASLRDATAISGFQRTATGQDVGGLLADVTSSTDLVSNLDGYESELVKLDATVAGAFGSAGVGHSSAPIDTTGITGDLTLRLRIPTALENDLGLVTGCDVRLEAGPMWRSGGVAQPSAYVASDLTVLSCPGPTVTSAVATSVTAVTVTFSRPINPATVLTDGSQFTADNGLTFSAAAVSGNTVTLTSSTQTPGTGYTVTVANTVQDNYGGGLAIPDSATFSGFVQPAVLRLTEINPNITSSHDLIELQALSAGTLDGIRIEQVGSTVETLITMPSTTVASGDLIVVHLVPSGVVGIAPSSETTSKTEFPAAGFSANYDGAWDLLGGTIGLTFSNRVIRVVDATNAIQDAVPFVLTTSASPPAAFPANLQALQTAGLWLPADCGGSPCTYLTTPSAIAVSVPYDGAGNTATGNSVQRKPATDTNQNSDWYAAGAQTFGAANP